MSELFCVKHHSQFQDADDCPIDSEPDGNGIGDNVQNKHRSAVMRLYQWRAHLRDPPRTVGTPTQNMPRAQTQAQTQTQAARAQKAHEKQSQRQVQAHVLQKPAARAQQQTKSQAQHDQSHVQAHVIQTQVATAQQPSQPTTTSGTNDGSSNTLDQELDVLVDYYLKSHRTTHGFRESTTRSRRSLRVEPRWCIKSRIDSYAPRYREEIMTLWGKTRHACDDERNAAKQKLLELLRCVRMFEMQSGEPLSKYWPDETSAEQDNDVEIVDLPETDATCYYVDDETLQEIEENNIYVKKEPQTGTE